ncbi:CG14077 [Drosophila busckii]|uniref:CG14077 n=1 Tax=Drosophila busckii TaxID=30019 RepID=A0A0M5J5S9_DROBS|nr:glutamic acid-rich protein [Drosophila busckii]ALC43756.1 CG14077 [Drosophila busckii]
MLHILKFGRFMRLQCHNISYTSRVRMMSGDSKSDGDKCKSKKEESKCKSKKEEPIKEESKCEEESKKSKDDTEIQGGTKCKPPEDENSECQEEKPKGATRKPSCEELLLKREGMNAKKDKCNDIKKISGGAPKCPKKCPPPPPCEGQASARWKKITLMGVIPIVALLSAFVLTHHSEKERPEFVRHPHMYIRSKPFYFGDHIRSQYHNKHWNAIPPDGYEDEIDTGAIGKTPETEKERADREKEFQAVHKDWKKMISQREAEEKKQNAAAEKEAKKAQAEAEKEEKQRQKEAEKEEKRQQAEADKEAKRLQKEAKKVAYSHNKSYDDDD